MLRRCFLIAGLTASFSAAAEAAPLEINTATQAQLESLPGVGPALAEGILIAREKRPFSGWADLRQRVRGVGEATAKKLSAQGLRVNGQTYKSTTP